ncbi:hypothetical protein PIB30_066850 [Stylosanthes scabra]|uniref:Uncharacterized protein n=1 Tax=Stylosanthes scabra TaxID=79078 RepID=A0ABU6TPT8_9FABA|nr:hypothetical protein [Stylosanthes scabra]
MVTPGTYSDFQHEEPVCFLLRSGPLTIVQTTLNGVPSLNIRDDSFFLVGHSFVALFLENWALGPVHSIAPTRELELLWANLPRFRRSSPLRFSQSQPSVVEADALPELRREMRLTVDRATEGDFVLEAAGSSDRLPFWAQEDRTHYLWVYTELFTRLGVRLPFTDFQREVLSRCRMAASQVHLNGWGFLCTFERVCLHFGFRL